MLYGHSSIRIIGVNICVFNPTPPIIVALEMRKIGAGTIPIGGGHQEQRAVGRRETGKVIVLWIGRAGAEQESEYQTPA